jgi:hypothetical protein
MDDHGSDDHYSTVLNLLGSASVLSNTALDLSKRDITELPEEDFPPCPSLECLYLEGNRLTHLPGALFMQCPALRWLDLRNNSLKSLSPQIENLKCLRTLLLEGNQLIELPCELGNLDKLSGLSLSSNPLQYPPKEIIEQGTKIVLEYLKEMSKQRIITPQMFEHDSSDEDNDPQLDKESIKKYHTSDSLSKSNHRDINLKGVYLSKATLQARQKNHSKKSLELRNTLSNSSKNGTHNEFEEDGKSVNRKEKIQRAKTTKDKEDIERELSRERSKQSLNEWKEETKRLQIKAKNVTYTGGRKAPFAVDGEGKTSAQLSIQSFNDDSSSTSKEDSEVLITEWTKGYARKLQETRENGGLLSNPASDDLLEAEHKLAEVTTHYSTSLNVSPFPTGFSCEETL